jgi:hypothetical protein
MRENASGFLGKKNLRRVFHLSKQAIIVTTEEREGQGARLINQGSHTGVGAESFPSLQAAEKLARAVILSEAKNLCICRIRQMRRSFVACGSSG